MHCFINDTVTFFSRFFCNIPHTSFTLLNYCFSYLASRYIDPFDCNPVIDAIIINSMPKS